MSEDDTISVRGFLSGEVDGYRKRYRKTYSDAFAACEVQSDMATRRLFRADLSCFNSVDDLHIISAIALWMRCLSTCQATVLLLERGMIPEAQTLIRTAYEFLFYAVATLKDPDVFESMKEGDSHARRVQANSMAEEGRNSGDLSNTQMEELTIIANEYASGRKQIDAFDAARRAGLAYLYSTVYRGMSFVAAHPTLASTNAMMEERGDGFGLKFGPSELQIEFSLGLIETCLKTGAKHFDALLSSNA